ncbi:poly adp-ribose polymerase member 14-like protein [Stylonychia lemnae]|uniref:Poly [ADP-ribose] polymerase n=1 Tax=Stylonychia lemnae TaxID=5949 RepID=A0A078APZ4_STYLE|nr:poly adp-ribose polymerase member 14-like protein [Stylonychia lemnae]|eukprot:CDW84239.1 poly adp-ribose polymerase member 14-like protein [Stylonychia lemnae]
MERFIETGASEAAFQILEILQYYLDISLLDKSPSQSEIMKYGNLQKETPLIIFFQKQQNYQNILMAIQNLQRDYDILGLKLTESSLLQRQIDQFSLLQIEEEKQLVSIPRENQIQEFSKEDQDLIDIYGDRIKFVEWYFENNDVIQRQALQRQKQKEYMRANINQIHQILPKNFKFFNEVGYQCLSPEQSKLIENVYQEYLTKGGLQETFIQSGDDIYSIRFQQELYQKNQGWRIVNSISQIGRELFRKIKLKGPFQKQKTVRFYLINPLNNNVLEEITDLAIIQNLKKAYETVQIKNKEKTQVLQFRGEKVILYLNPQALHDIKLLRLDGTGIYTLLPKTSSTKWDYVATFKPTARLSIQSGQIYCKELLQSTSLEYQFVQQKFISTFHDNRIRQQSSLNNQINAAQLKPNILRIEKIYNCVIYERFVNEYKRMLRKYTNLQPSQILKHLFHGTKETQPQLIYESETGLDIRFSRKGLYGEGVYFADNSAYSNTYCSKTTCNESQMFLALVLVGDSVYQPQNQSIRIPPLKPISRTDRYDSINNGQGGHYIIYDNLKSYPGYLITYKSY